MAATVRMVDPRRARPLNSLPERKGPVIYWMSRDQRVRHNWALLYAAEKALERDRTLEVVFTLAPSFPGATLRHYDFMFKGLQEVETVLRKSAVPFTVLTGDPGPAIVSCAKAIDAGIVVTDFSPLNITKAWKTHAAEHLRTAFCEVDAHNIVPCWLASSKQEYAARTLRPKLRALLPEFYTPFPSAPMPIMRPQPERPPVDWLKLMEILNPDTQVKPVVHPQPGEEAAHRRLRQFIETGLCRYALERNDPNGNAVSGLSPYLHFGQISAQHVALEVQRSSAPQLHRDAFIEELVVRRELAENYCHYNARYDTFGALPGWARQTLMNHAGDRREYICTAEQFEQALTHDPLWNAAQKRLAETGTMHGYMRMYWAKKILEWSAVPEQAFDLALMLNDRYALDGRDPNGFTGVAWSIGGLHDRPWFERPVYGTVRYMNAAGCARKFDVRQYIGGNPMKLNSLPLFNQ